MFNGFRMWTYAIGAAFVAGLVIAVKVLKKQRDLARRTADPSRAGRESNRKKNRIIKEEELQTDSRTAELIREIEERKNAEEFQGVDNLSDPNDNW